MADDAPTQQTATPAPTAPAQKTVYPYRFGEVGVMMGVLNRDQVRESLNLQKQRKAEGLDLKVGELLVERGFLTPRQIAAVLVAQKRYRADQAGGATPSPGPTPAPAETAKPAAQPAAVPPAQPAPAAPVQPAAAAVAAAPAKTRQKLGPYELIDKIGEGAMGQVFTAWDAARQKNVAVKILPRQLAMDQEFLERFKREVKLMAQLDHPHIVAFYDAGAHGGVFYLAMEYVDGGDLTKKLRTEARLAEPEALRIAREMALALAQAHGKGMIHRDIKPDNVLLMKDGMSKISDFGLAKPTEDNQKLTAAGFSIGTPFYISPEQALGKENVDHRCDLYGLGATLFHMLTGRVPFEHTSSTQVMVMHVQNQPPDPRSINPAISRGAAQLVLKLLAKDPAQRHQSAQELADVLERVLKGEQPEEPKAKTAKQEKPAGGFVAWLKRLLGMK